MAKVGRAAFNSSRMRVETLTGNKTIATAEAGEVYLVNAAREITLPAAQDGAYFKVIVNTKFAGNTNLVISASGGALLKGGIAIVAAGSVNNISDVGEANGTDHNTLTISGGSGPPDESVLVGTYVECVCDGTDWTVTGLAIVEGNNGNAAFSAV